MSVAKDYIDAVQAKLTAIANTQLDSISEAAEYIRKSIASGGVVYLFGTGHSHMLAEEGHYRAGGLAAVCPVLSTSLMLHEGAVSSTQIERTRGIAKAVLSRYQPTDRDTIIIFSNSGVNGVPVEMALAAREAGMTVIAIVALAYAAELEPRVEGKKLADLAHVVIDNQGEPGDALVQISTSGIKAGPLSTVAGAMILNAMLVEAASALSTDDAPPPVYISANMPGAKEHNAGLIEQYRPRNPHL